MVRRSWRGEWRRRLLGGAAGIAVFAETSTATLAADGFRGDLAEIGRQDLLRVAFGRGRGGGRARWR